MPVAVEWSSIILCIRWIRRVTHEDDLDKAQCIHCLWLKSRWNRWEICEYDEMNFLFVCTTWIQRSAVAWICVHVHVHAAECIGMKLISACMRKRRTRQNSDECAFHWVQQPDLYQQRPLRWVLWKCFDCLKILRNEIQIQISTWLTWRVFLYRN